MFKKLNNLNIKSNSLVKIADWLVKNNEPKAAQKLLMQSIKENPSDKSIRAEYVILVKKIKSMETNEQLHSQENQTTENNNSL